MDNQIQKKVIRANFNLILCEEVEVFNEKQSFIGVFDEIRVDKNMNGKFSCVVAYDILFPKEYENQSPIYKMQLSIDFLRTKEGQRGKKKLPIQAVEIPAEDGGSDSGAKQMLCAGEEKGVAGISGFYVFNISTAFIGEGQYQCELRGKDVLCEQVNVTNNDMHIIALRPFSVIKTI